MCIIITLWTIRLDEVIGKLINALKLNGVLYMSFKYGNSDREKDGRQFTDLDETQTKALLEQFDHVQQIKQWITVDQRPDRQEKWLNLLWKKHAWIYSYITTITQISEKYSADFAVGKF